MQHLECRCHGQGVVGFAAERLTRGQAHRRSQTLAGTAQVVAHRGAEIRIGVDRDVPVDRLGGHGGVGGELRLEPAGGGDGGHRPRWYGPGPGRRRSARPDPLATFALKMIGLSVRGSDPSIPVRNRAGRSHHDLDSIPPHPVAGADPVAHPRHGRCSRGFGDGTRSHHPQPGTPRRHAQALGGSHHLDPADDRQLRR